MPFPYPTGSLSHQRHCCKELDLPVSNDEAPKSLSPDYHHSDVWRWLWQFWYNMKTQQHVLSAKLRCGGRNLVSLRPNPFLGPSVSPPWITPLGFTVRCPSALDNLNDRLTSVRRVNWYTSAELMISSNSMGGFRIPSASLCSLLGHPTHRT